MTGRWHSGDENGYTQYEYATIKVVNETGSSVGATIEVADIQWSEYITETSKNGFQAPSNRVIVGRQHIGDENGKTRYATAEIRVNGITAQTFDTIQSQAIKESAGIWYITGTDYFLTGRLHMGDENGNTYYYSSRLQILEGHFDEAPKGTIIVPYIRNTSESMKESSSSFLCPRNTVMTGRFHVGDENGTTQYQYATLRAIDTNGKEITGIITVEDILWEDEKVKAKESVAFQATENRVIVGRRHFGDENAVSSYATAVIKFNGYPTYVANYSVSEIHKETGGWITSPSNAIITGRQHYDDENGYSFLEFGQIYCQKQNTINLPFDLIVSLHENEDYFPMNAVDFIKLSRFRQHVNNGTDLGYNKVLGQFISGNSQSYEYYNIPVAIINSYYCKEQHKRLYNLRPYGGDMEYKGNARNSNYFLQPFAHLKGDYRPNGRTCTYVNILTYEQLTNPESIIYFDFWIFFGYDYAKWNYIQISFSHEGDWEHVMVKVIGNRIIGAWLSQHTDAPYYDASQLELVTINGRQTLKVYCAAGSHALYNKPGTFPIAGGDYDYTSPHGVPWKITSTTKHLLSEPWALFAGAWGEVGGEGIISPLGSQNTGPLGPWFKRFDYWDNTALFNISSFFEYNKKMIIPNEIYISDPQIESNSEFVGADNMVMIGRKHTGDENGETVCLFATLQAIVSSGLGIFGSISIVNTKWDNPIKESDSSYYAPDGYVILGRRHTGDENGYTQYKIGKILFNNVPTEVIPIQNQLPYQEYAENAGVFFRTTPYSLFTGRIHKGDEKGVTYNLQAVVRTTI